MKFWEGCHFFKWGFWVRMCGYGLHVQTSKNHRKLFSERIGKRCAHYGLGLRVEFFR